MNLTKTNQKDTDDWEQIRNWVGAANKDTKHPLHQEIERLNRQKPEHFDEGGEAGDDLEDVPRGTMAPVVPAPAAPIPDSSYQQKANQALGGITPETIQRLEQSLNHADKRALPGEAIAGIGDAIASVGGQKGEHMKGAQDLVNQRREEALKIPGEMASIGKERYGVTKELAGEAPDSMRSFVAQNANRSLLKQMGFQDADIKKMPASLIDGIRSGAITLEDAKAQLGLKAATLGLQEKQAEATIGHQKTEEGIAKEGRAQEAAKTLANKGMFKSILDMIPGTAGYKATEVLENQENEGSFQLPAVGQTVDHPSGAKITRNN